MEEDNERPVKVVLLGVTGVGKSSLANSLLHEQEVFQVGHTSSSCTKIVTKKTLRDRITGIPITILDAPGFGDSDGEDPILLERIVQSLQEERLISAFLVVLNGENPRFDAQTLTMLKAYTDMFGVYMFYNVVFVVTHWGMDDRQARRRERSKITTQSFAEGFVEKLRETMKDAPSINHTIPFVFIDNDVLNIDDDDCDPSEKSIFERARISIFEHVLSFAAFPCANVKEVATAAQITVEIRMEAETKLGLTQCSQCKRYFDLTTPSEETKTGMKASGGSWALIGTARLLRVSKEAQRVWNPQVAKLAMTRGWTGNTAVQIFGRWATYIGPFAAIAVGVYRVATANTKTEGVQAIVGTGAGLAGGKLGASTGMWIGSMLWPGVGTVIGGVVGGIAGAVAAQYTGEKAVELVATSVDNLCMNCRAAK